MASRAPAVQSDWPRAARAFGHEFARRRNRRNEYGRHASLCRPLGRAAVRRRQVSDQNITAATGARSGQPPSGAAPARDTRDEGEQSADRAAALGACRFPLLGLGADVGKDARVGMLLRTRSTRRAWRSIARLTFYIRPPTDPLQIRVQAKLRGLARVEGALFRSRPRAPTLEEQSWRTASLARPLPSQTTRTSPGDPCPRRPLPSGRSGRLDAFHRDARASSNSGAQSAATARLLAADARASPLAEEIWMASAAPPVLWRGARSGLVAAADAGTAAPTLRAARSSRNRD